MSEPCPRCGTLVDTSDPRNLHICNPNKQHDGLVVSLENYRSKKPEHVWECNCGGQLFYLHDDGGIECRSCKTIKTTLLWGYNP